MPRRAQQSESSRTSPGAAPRLLPALGLLLLLFGGCLSDEGRSSRGSSGDPSDLGVGPDVQGTADLAPPDTDLEAEDLLDSPDASDRDGASAEEDGGEASECPDRFEPNDQVVEATPLRSGMYRGLSICETGDRDVFRFELQRGEHVQVHALFAHADGDLELQLTNTSSGRVERAESGTDNEFLQTRAASSGDYLLEIWGFGGATNRYDLALRLGSDCEEDGAEPNDDPDEAQLVDEGTHRGVLCPQDEDWLRVDGVEGETLLAALRFLHDEGDLELQALRADASGELVVVAESRGDGDVESVELGPLGAGEAGPHYLRVYGYRGAWASYELFIDRAAEGEGRRTTVTGVVTRDHLPVTPEGYGAVEVQPAEEVRVELVRAADDRAIASTRTGTGGSFRLSGVNRGAPGLYLRALAQWELKLGGRPAKVVDTSASGRLHAYRGPEVHVDDQAEGSWETELHIPAEGGPAGAFNIIAAVRRGLSTLSERPDLHWDWPELTVRWQPDHPFRCGSCFYDDTIDLGGGREDPDEFDDSIILHELGHYVARNRSRDDSPGGSHDGTPTDPRLAWSEGFATFFSTWVRGDPIYLDYRITDTLLQDLDGRDDPRAFSGPEGGEPGGAISEYLVSSMLWDLSDGPVEDDDPVPGDGRALAPIFGYMAREERADHGAWGTDLFDYLDGYVCHQIGAEEPFVDAVRAREFPYDVSGAPRGCETPEGKASSPLQAWLERSHGGRLELLLRSRVDSPRATLRVLGRSPRELGPLQAGDLYRFSLSDEGHPLPPAGVTLHQRPGLRLHAVVRRPLAPRIVRGARRSPPPRRLRSDLGEPILQWGSK